MGSSIKYYPLPKYNKESTTKYMESVEINGLKLKPNTLYKIIDKVDNNALDGLKNYGATKIPQEGIADQIQCPYDRVSNIYDTGFYVQSPCYKGVDHDVRQKYVDLIRKLVVEPYERVYGLDILDNRNEAFWNTYFINLDEGRIFNTGKADDMLALYIAMRAFKLTPRERIGDPRFKKSHYLIEDRDVTLKKKNERKDNYMKAMENFFLMVAGEKHKLIATLKYSRMPGADSFNNDTPNSTINSLFKDWVDNDTKNVDDFNRVVKMSNTKKGTEEITLYSLLLELQKSKKLVRIGEEYAYEEVPLGADLKTAARNLSNKKGLADIKNQIIKTETST